MDHAIAVLFEESSREIRMENPARRCIRVSKKLGASGSTSTKCILHQIIHPLKHSRSCNFGYGSSLKIVQDCNTLDVHEDHQPKHSRNGATLLLGWQALDAARTSSTEDIALQTSSKHNHDRAVQP